jgi:ADP-heptose:LPS heptosyltransferase
MTEILFIKTSSMGDVLHHMPAVTDAHRRFPEARISWVVDELYAPLAALHPAVAEIVPIAVRRWRKKLLELPTWNEVREATAKLRARTLSWNTFEPVVPQMTISPVMSGPIALSGTLMRLMRPVKGT